MFDRALTDRFALQVPPPPPVERMLTGRTAQEAAALLPRIFNLCREAQGIAAELALGLPMAPEAETRLAAEIRREHVAKLCLQWPRHLDLPALALPPGWQADARSLALRLFGPSGRAPATSTGLQGFLASETGLAPLLRAIHNAFAPHEAASVALPRATPERALELDTLENSVAARHERHPLMRQTESRLGRGPFWRALGRVLDLDALLAEGAPPFVSLRRGCAVVPAARGTYAIRIALDEAGRVAALTRRTPTDHLLVPGGVLEQSLTTLPADKAGLAGLVVDILDPCTPLTVRPLAREPDHA